MSEYAINKVVDLAISQVGYTETGTNITKYASYIDKNYPNFYNTKKQGAEWCDVFVDYLFLYNFGESNAEAMLYQPKKSAGAGCKFSANYYKAKNAWYTSPKRGDQVFFYVKGTIGHTGIVTSVSGGVVTTVEGNKGNAVKKCTYKVGDSSIAGYGRPKYSVIPEPTPAPTPAPTPTPKPTGDKIMIEVRQLQKGNSGEDVKTVQRILRQEGYKYNKKLIVVDGDFGTATDNCVTQYQKNHSAKCGKADGIVGTKTWNCLING